MYSGAAEVAMAQSVVLLWCKFDFSPVRSGLRSDLDGCAPVGGDVDEVDLLVAERRALSDRPNGVTAALMKPPTG